MCKWCILLIVSFYLSGAASDSLQVNGRSGSPVIYRSGYSDTSLATPVFKESDLDKITSRPYGATFSGLFFLVDGVAMLTIGIVNIVAASVYSAQDDYGSGQKEYEARARGAIFTVFGGIQLIPGTICISVAGVRWRKYHRWNDSIHNEVQNGVSVLYTTDF